MSLIKCPECGNSVSDNARNCPKCGYSFTKMKFCKYCGEKIPEDSVVCTKCGRQVEDGSKVGGGITINNAATSSASASSSSQSVQNTQNAREKKEINKVTSLILCIFFGYFGTHKFYEGKVGLGILYLFTLGIFCIGWIVDIIIISMKPNPYYI